MTRTYKPATFQPTIRPDWGGAVSYIPNEEKALILEAMLKYPSIECNSKFWLETIKPEFDFQYSEFLRICEQKSRGIRNRWGKTSITPVKDMNNISNRSVIDSKSKDKGKSKSKSKEEENKKYFFFGKVIKLNEKDSESWQKAYPELNLYAECLVRDEYLATLSNTEQKNWFMSTARYFVKQNEIRKQQHQESEIAELGVF